MIDNLLRIPLGDKEFKRELAQMRARADKAIALAKKNYGFGQARLADVDKGSPVPSKKGYRPQAKKWRTGWAFPSGMRLNFSRWSKRRKQRAPYLKRREAYLKNPEAYIKSLKGGE